MIVDASVAIKWVVQEEDSDLAAALIGHGALIAPDLVASEIANAMWKKWRRKELTTLPEDLASILTIFDSIEPSGPLLSRATALAIELDHPAYDCFYLALAEKSGERIVTADAKLVRKLAGTPYAALVHGLGPPA